MLVRSQVSLSYNAVWTLLLDWALPILALDHPYTGPGPTRPPWVNPMPGTMLTTGTYTGTAGRPSEEMGHGLIMEPFCSID